MVSLRRQGATVVVMLSLAIAGGCGGSSEKKADPPDPSTPTPTATPPSPTPTVTPPTGAELQNMMLNLDDLAQGWRGGRLLKPSDLADPAGDAQTAACLGVKDTTPDVITTVTSMAFAKGSGAEAYSTGQTFPPDDVAIDRDSLKDVPRAERCAQQSITRDMRSLVGKGAQISSPRTTFTPGSGVVLGTLEFEAIASTPDQSVHVYARESFLAGPTTEVVLVYLGTSPADTQEWQDATNAVAARVH